jgi:HD-GYP domain-containing protein (c-di-GMP phosphodiesterase class II)
MSEHPSAPHTTPLTRPAHDLTSQLRLIHGLVRSRYPFVDRIALALYEPATDRLKTFVSSNTDEVLLKRYEVELSQVPSLMALVRERRSRVVNDIAETFTAHTTHTDWLAERGYRASYTTPVFHGEQLAAFLFFDSKEPGTFSVETGQFMDTFADLIAQLFLLQRQVVDGMLGTIKVAVGLARIRDLETGQHLERMAQYSRLMAQALAERHGLSDEVVEYVYLFAPLHDIGKVGIPDRILLKPGKLDAEEWAVMKQHVSIGEQIIDKIASEMDLADSLPARVMRDIVAGHHERGDGSGYPRGLMMADIPLVARIVAVADVYDALSNRRPYKQAWGEDDIVKEMRREAAAGRLDTECVESLLAAVEARQAILTRFADQVTDSASV